MEAYVTIEQWFGIVAASVFVRLNVPVTNGVTFVLIDL
jgi:hypothetical protein